MDIVLIRHPPRERNVEEKMASLTPEGRRTAEQLAASLPKLSAGSSRLPSPFTIIVSSTQQPAKEMAGLLERTPDARVRDMDCLTPFAPGGDDFRAFFEDLQARVGPVTDSDVIAVVGHEPRLGRLLSFLTSKETRCLDRGEAVWLRASIQDFRKGKGILCWSTLNVDSAKTLREKVQSKMAVCTFLAGFSSAALVEILKEADKMLQPSRMVGAVSFAAALGLFAAAIYIYDELSMPSEFWKNTNPPKLSRSQFAFDFLMNGALYAHMVRTWRFFFTPALLFSLAGFFALLSANFREAKGLVVSAACAAAIIFAWIMYRWFRPKLAID